MVVGNARRLRSAAKKNVLSAASSFSKPRKEKFGGAVKNRPGSIVTEAPVDPHLAVIVPAYNVENYLEDCVNSVISQSFRNWEMLIIDDGSLDGTGAIADRLAVADARIQVIHQENRGLGAARNVGIDRSKAPYMTFIDSDDLIAPDAFSKMMGALSESGSDVAIGSIDRFNSTRHWTPFWVELVHDERRVGITAKELPAVMWDVFACNKIFKRSTWSAVVGKFPTGTVYEDQECTAKLFVNDATLDILPDIVYHWRHREDGQSITQQKSNVDDLTQRIRVAEHVQSIVSGYTDSYVDYWYEKCLGEDFYYYYREVPRTAPDFFEVLQNGVRKFYDAAPSEAVANIDPPRRWLAYLAAYGTREELVDLLIAFDTYRTYFKTTVDGNELSAIVPGLETTFAAMPTELLVIQPEQLQAQAVLTEIASDASGTLTVEGFGYVPNLDCDLKYSVLLRGESIELGADSVKILDEGPGALTRDPYNPHKKTKFSARFSASSIDRAFAEFDRTESEPFDLVIRMHLAEHSWEVVNPKRSSEGPASWPAPTEVTSGGHRFVTLGDPASGTRLRVLTPRFAIRSIGFEDNMLRLSAEHLRGTHLPNHDRFELSSAVLRIRSGDRIVSTAPVTANGDTFVASIPVGEVAATVRGSFSGKQLVELVCNGRFVAPLAMSPSLVTGCASRGLISADTSGYGYLELKRDIVSTTVASADFDAGRDQFVVEGKHFVDADSQRIFAPSLAFVSPLSVVRCDDLHWERDTGSFVARFNLTVAGEVAFEPGKYILQNLMPTGQASPATLWVSTEVDFERNLPRDIPTALSNIRMSALGKSRALQVTVTGRGVTKDSQSALQVRLRSEHYFSDASRPVDEGTVFFETFGGSSVADSPKEIDRVLANKYPKLKRYWSVKDPSVKVPEGALPVVVGTSEWMKRLSTCAVIINNNNFPHYFRKASKQTYIQTWHGTPLKKIGNDVPGANLSLRYRNLMVKEAENEWDILLAQSEWAGKQLAAAFGYKGPVFDEGYPRNDRLTSDEQMDLGKSHVLQKYGISQDKTIVLYAPTWRDHLKDPSGRYSRVDFLNLPKAIKTLGHDYVILYRGHSNSVDSVQKELPAGVVDVSRHSDVNDLISAADVMITDYSSIMFDFVVTGKPIAFVAPDLSRYRDETRGFYFDFVDEAPGPIFSRADDATAWIKSSKNGNVAHTEKYVNFLSRFAPMDDGMSSARFVNKYSGLFETPELEG